MNEDQNKFTKARSDLLDSIYSEFLGPLKTDILTENPVTRFAAGMIYPRDYQVKTENDPNQNQKPDGEDDQINAGDNSVEDVSAIGLANSFFPSVIGISFYCDSGNPELVADLRWTTYTKIEPNERFVEIEKLPQSVSEIDEFKNNFKFVDGKLYVIAEEIEYEISGIIAEKSGDASFKDVLDVAIRRAKAASAWVNANHQQNIVIDTNLKRKRIADGLDIICDRKLGKGRDSSLYTIAVQNMFSAAQSGMDDEHVFFNVSIAISDKTGNKEIFTEYSTPPLFKKDVEEQSLALLYRERKAFAVGHGCAADWKKNQDSTNAFQVFTKSLPTFEVPQTDFEISGLDPLTLSMKFLSDSGSSKKEIIEKLNTFQNLYGEWISSLSKNKIPEMFAGIANKHILLCKEIQSRMQDGIRIIDSNKTAMEAFSLANKSMLMQSLHSEFQKIKKQPNTEPLVFPSMESKQADDRKWRPFQLAFLLLSIKGIVDPNCEDRKIVDLIWFPTGGGKTEAYLGLSAFAIFYRRLNDLKHSGGTAIMMRYTLRLLTAQQFQRACTLICSMEKLRREDPKKFGDEEISIGLWVGLESTPNTLDQAKTSFDQYITGASEKNPSPLLSCPWCGSKMLIDEGDGRKSYGYKTKPKKANLYCLEHTCDFNERLPILIVDEEIYDTPPTLLFGTVDKFAQMPFQKGISSLFSVEPSNHNLPPELIIQDELHLISGALGTLVGIYETSIDYLCSIKGIRPKIIASTATVRRAAEQCRSLFNRETRQFPPPGINIDDSFFSRETPLTKRPGRLYVGLMPSGKTQTTSSIRLTASLLRSVTFLNAEDYVKDKYWTLVSYFNSIRELGGFISLLYDDIPLYANALRQRYGGMMRHIAIERELTSRKNAEEITEILEQLSVSYPDYKCIDVLSATNMISVGVDIDRLGLMVIRGQPKMTSEYIQVSSRIGRKFPGLVTTLYNSARTRDRAHYERFRTYHESFYRNVEPSSVTPFSAPARDRALSAILVTLFRHGLGSEEFSGEQGASKFNSNSPEMKKIKEYIFERVKSIDPEEADSTIKKFEDLVHEWDIFNQTNGESIVYKNEKQGIPLTKKLDQVGGGLWSLPTSMRNVDAECNIDIRDD